MKTKKLKKSYCLCKKCFDKIPFDTNKVLTYCTCKAIYVDGCEYYSRIGGNKENYEFVEK